MLVVTASAAHMRLRHPLLISLATACVQVLPVSEGSELDLDISGIAFSPSGRRWGIL